VFSPRHDLTFANEPQELREVVNGWVEQYSALGKFLDSSRADFRKSRRDDGRE